MEVIFQVLPVAGIGEIGHEDTTRPEVVVKWVNLQLLRDDSRVADLLIVNWATALLLLLLLLRAR
jgi:hypothetical protein